MKMAWDLYNQNGKLREENFCVKNVDYLLDN